MDIKEKFIKEFNQDLPISGHDGSSIKKCIVIHHDVWLDISTIEWFCIRNLLANKEYIWKYADKSIKHEKSKVFEIVKIFIYFIDKGKLKSVFREFYFDISMIQYPDLSIDNTGDPFISHHEPSNLYQYASIGYTLFQRKIDNEKSAKGMGVTYEYGCPGYKLSLNIYNKGNKLLDIEKTKDKLYDEFEQTNSNILAVDDFVQGDYEFLDNETHISSMFSGVELDSILGLSIINNHFFKFRYSYQKQIPEEIRREMNEEIEHTFSHFLKTFRKE